MAYVLDASTATEPAPGSPNDDFFLVADSWAIVLDGVSAPPVPDVGCVHDVPWFVAHLGSHLGAALTVSEPSRPLTAILAEAIERTASDHGPRCDLSHPLTPAATVAAARISEDQLHWLVLGDAAVAWQFRDGVVEAVSDDRPARSLRRAPLTESGVRRADLAYVAKVRNTPEGFWVAAANPDAAAHAITGALPLDELARVGLYTDGVTRLVERYGHSWTALFELVTSAGAPRALIDAVRAAETSDPDPQRWRGKRHDDATAVIAQPKRRPSR